MLERKDERKQMVSFEGEGVWDIGTVALGICLLVLDLAGGWLVFV